MSRLIAVLDANVLYGITPTDLLITLAVRDAYRPHWSEAILDETIRNLTTNRPDLDPDKITQRFTLMNRALDGASIPAPPDSLVGEMTNDINDRHVLATAVMVGADVIVTENLRHFPPTSCAPHGIIAMSLDDFISELLDEQPTVVSDAITEMADRRNRPPITPHDLLKILERYIPQAVARLR